MKTLISAFVELEVPFHDVDVMGVVWHGHYLKYFEQARTALLQKIGFDYPQMIEIGYVWPVVESYVKYLRPIRYSQRIKVDAQMVEYENRLRMAYVITDRDTGEKLTKGETTQVAIEINTKELQFVSPRRFIEIVEQVNNG
ncbi:MAG: thioesterase family protein [Nitrospirota bacterium]